MTSSFWRICGSKKIARGLSIALMLMLALACGNGEKPAEDSDSGSSGSSSGGTGTPVENTVTVSFSTDVQPIFDSSCMASCHTSGGAAAFLPLSSDVSYGNLVDQPATRTTGGGTLVVPGSPSDSVLYQRITQSGTVNGNSPMPPSGMLGSSDIEKVSTWINEGALNN